MKDASMEDSNTVNIGNSGDSNLDFCTGEDFLSISNSTALVSPSGAEFDLIVKVNQNIHRYHYTCIDNIGYQNKLQLLTWNDN